MKKKRPKMDASGDYEVGYRKPPESTRFQKGQSGNPNGRPKKTKGLQEALNEELQGLMKVGGNHVPVIQVLARSLISNAIKGKPSAMDRIFGHLASHDAKPEEEQFEPEIEDMMALKQWAAKNGYLEMEVTDE